MQDQSGIHKLLALLGQGAQTRIAEHFNITQQAVQKWAANGVVPAKWVIPLESFCGGAVSRHELNPEIYPADIKE